MQSKRYNVEFKGEGLRPATHLGVSKVQIGRDVGVGLFRIGDPLKARLAERLFFGPHLKWCDARSGAAPRRRRQQLSSA
jgi:hypothetical protein